MVDSMATGWFYLGGGAPGGRQMGPVTWEQLYGLARSGAVGPQDLVWNPALPQWLPASQVPGLFAGPATPAGAGPYAGAPGLAPGPGGAPRYGRPVASPVYAPPGYAPRGPQPARSGRPTWLLPVLIPLVALILVGGGLGAYFGFARGGGTVGGGTVGGGTVGDSTVGSTVPGGGSSSTVSSQTATTAQGADVGTIEVTLPDSTKLIETAAWGEVPANQIGVILAAGKTRADADQIAQTLGGTIVGELAYLNLYQIQTTGTTEADLQATVDQAAAAPGVELAFPNQQALLQEEIWGVRESPLNDPAYSGNYGKGYELIGAQKAWSFIRGSGLPLSPVKVGIVDDGLYKGTGEFDGDSKTEFPDPNAGELADPEQLDNVGGGTVANPNGSHGTMVSGIIGADPANGGQAGIASTALGDNLTMSVINMFGGQYGRKEVQPDPNDPTQYLSAGGKTYSIGGLAAMLKQVQAKAKVINCSFGAQKPDANNALLAAAYRKFFEKMAKDHPDVTFVCAAGNEKGELSKTNYWPAGAGSGLSNVITVGNVMNDGDEATSSNLAGPDGEVTIAAPGHEVVQGTDDAGDPITNQYEVGGKHYGGGTSAAAPQVSAAAALLLSLKPDLTSERIKEILTQTARPGPDAMGGGILAIEEAVLMVINEVRADREPKLPPLTREQLENMGVIDAVATSGDQPDVYSVRGILASVPDNGTQVTITASGGATVDGDTTRSIAAAGEVEWPKVTIKGGQGTVTVARKDSGASSVITWTPPDVGPVDGHWEGELIQDMSTGIPLTYVLTLDLSGIAGAPGEAKVDIHFADLSSDSAPYLLEVTEAAGTTTIRITDGSGFLMTGTMTGPDRLEGSISGNWTGTWYATRTP